MGAIAERSSILDSSSAGYDPLPGAIRALERALGAALVNDSNWAGRVAPALRDQVLGALKLHAALAEVPDGMLTEYQTAMPRLTPRIERLRDDHLCLCDEAEELLGTMEKLAAGGRVSVDGVRSRLAFLRAGLCAHALRETNLVFEAVDRELGVAD